MPITLIHPMNENLPAARPAPARLASLAGKTIGLLDISKPGGDIFLDHLEILLRERHGAARIIRARKPTFTRVAPPDVLDPLRAADAVIEALAD